MRTFAHDPALRGRTVHGMPRAKTSHVNTQPALVSTAWRIVQEVLRLVSSEFRLFRAELKEKISVIGIGLAFGITGTLLLIVAVVLLLVAAISALVDQGFGLTAATLMIFGIALVGGAGCLWFGMHHIAKQNLLPNKTIAQVQKDFESIAPETK